MKAFFFLFGIGTKKKLSNIKRIFHFLFGCFLDVERGAKEIMCDKQT